MFLLPESVKIGKTGSDSSGFNIYWKVHWYQKPFQGTGMVCDDNMVLDKIALLKKILNAVVGVPRYETLLNLSDMFLVLRQLYLQHL